MADKLEVINGGIDKGDWEFDGLRITKGFYNIQEIPVADIVEVKKIEETKNKVYANFELGCLINFTASMPDKTYAKIYDSFVKNGDNPTNEKLPIIRKSKGNIVSATIGGLILLAMFSGGERSSSENNKEDPLDEITLITYCEMKIEDLSLYGAQFDGSIRGLKKYKYNNNSGYKIEFPFQIKNAFGTWKKSFASCDFSNSGSIKHLRIDNETIF